MIAGTAVPTIIVETTVPTKIAGTNIFLVAVPTTFLGTVVSTNVGGTTIHISSMKRSVNLIKTLQCFFWVEMNKKLFPFSFMLICQISLHLDFQI